MGPRATGHRRINGEDWGRGVGWGSVITSLGRGVQYVKLIAELMVDFFGVWGDGYQK